MFLFPLDFPLILKLCFFNTCVEIRTSCFLPDLFERPAHPGQRGRGQRHVHGREDQERDLRLRCHYRSHRSGLHAVSGEARYHSDTGARVGKKHRYKKLESMRFEQVLSQMAHKSRSESFSKCRSLSSFHCTLTWKMKRLQRSIPRIIASDSDIKVAYKPSPFNAYDDSIMQRRLRVLSKQFALDELTLLTLANVPQGSKFPSYL